MKHCFLDSFEVAVVALALLGTRPRGRVLILRGAVSGNFEVQFVFQLLHDDC